MLLLLLREIVEEEEEDEEEEEEEEDVSTSLLLVSRPTVYITEKSVKVSVMKMATALWKTFLLRAEVAVAAVVAAPSSLPCW